MKIISVIGARPNIMKVAPLIEEMSRYEEIVPMLIHTGQHYDRNMSKVFFDDLALPEPDIYLGVGSGSHAKQTARIMIKLEKVFLKEKPDLVLVVGDVNSTMASALTAAKLRIPIAHVEAGLRSFDRDMPEEINRVVTDSISNYLFAPSADAVKNLKEEGICKEKIFLVGNIMIDTLLKYKVRAAKNNILQKLGLHKKGYITLTLHRPSNVDEKGNFLKILDALEEIQRRIAIVFPMHPRTKKMIVKYGLLNRVKRMSNLKVASPLGYLDFLKLLCDSKLVLTDSGGIQEETTALRIPCITLREKTERPITVTEGTNIIAGNDTDKIIRETKNILKNGAGYGRIPKFWDGKTARRIVLIILKEFSKRNA